MTLFPLGKIRSGLHVRTDIKRLSVAGVGTGPFKPGHRVWRWHPSLSGELDETPDAAMQVATSIAAAGAILNATIDPRGVDAVVVFDYGTAIDTSGAPVFGLVTAPITIPAGFGGVAVSQAVTGLDADTQYFARARASNSNGETTSEFVSFQTSIDQPTSGPPLVDTAIRVVGLATQTSVTLSASFDMNGAAGLIHLERLVGSTYVEFSIPLSAPDGVQTITSTATALSPGVAYTFRARASNPNAPEPGGVVSGPIVVTTAPPDPVIPVPSLLPVGATTLTTAVVNARISQIVDVPVRWQFQYGLTTGYGSTTPLVIDLAMPPGGTEDVTATLSSLTSGTTYHYRLVVMRTDGVGGNVFTSDGSFSTVTPPDPTIPVPSLLPVGVVNDSSGTVNGRIDNIAEVPTKYQFEYGTDPSYGSATTLVTDSVIPAGGHENVTATITGLLPLTTYHYRLSASRVDDTGGFQHSVDGSFTTTAAPNGIFPVTSPLGVTGISATAATLNGRVSPQSPVSYHFEYGTTTAYGSSTTVSTISATGSTNQSVMVSGSVDPQNLTTQVFIDYGTDPDNLSTVVTAGWLVGTGAKPFGIIVGNLTPNTIYWFRARAVNSGGTSISTITPTRVRTLPSTTTTTVHVAVTGDNTTGDGTSAKPWKTIQKAVSTAGVGTVLMHAGQYPGQTVTSKPASLVTIMDFGNGLVELDFVNFTSAGNLNFEGNIAATGWSRPDLASVRIFEGIGTPTAKAGPVYWAAGDITAISKVTGGVCIRASNDANNFYFDNVQTRGFGYGFQAATNATPSSSYPAGWRFNACEFGPDHTFDATNIGGASNLRFIGCSIHDIKSVSNWTA
jgi:hypothetical protein